MLQGEALRRRGERSSPLQVCFHFATSLFGLGSARVSRVGDPSPLENQTIRPTQRLLEGIWCSSLQL